VRNVSLRRMREGIAGCSNNGSRCFGALAGALNAKRGISLDKLHSVETFCVDRLELWQLIEL
jgi:hypothetical protein